MRVGDYIARNLRLVDPELREQIDALERLNRVPPRAWSVFFRAHRHGQLPPGCVEDGPAELADAGAAAE